MPVFPHLCFIAVSAYVAVVLHGCGCGSDSLQPSHHLNLTKTHPDVSKASNQDSSHEDLITDEQKVSEQDRSPTASQVLPKGLVMKPSDGCLVKDIDLGTMPKDDLAPDYSAIGSVEFVDRKGNFQVKACCDEMKHVANIFMDSGRYGPPPSNETVKKNEKRKSKAVEKCGSPQTFDALINIKGFKGDGKIVVQRFCDHDFPTYGYSVPGYTVQKNERGIQGISDNACHNFTEMVENLDAYNNETLDDATAEVYGKKMDAAEGKWKDHMPNAFAMIFHLTFNKMDPTVTLPSVTGSMVQLPGTSTQHMASGASPLPAAWRPHAGVGGRAPRRARFMGEALARE